MTCFTAPAPVIGRAFDMRSSDMESLLLQVVVTSDDGDDNMMKKKTTMVVVVLLLVVVVAISKSCTDTMSACS